MNWIEVSIIVDGQTVSSREELNLEAFAYQASQVARQTMRLAMERIPINNICEKKTGSCGCACG